MRKSKKMQLAKVGLALVLATSAFPAVAKTYDLGGLPEGLVRSAGGTLNSANKIDYFTFSIPPGDDLAMNVAFLFNAGNIPGLNATLFRGMLNAGTQVGETVFAGQDSFFTGITAGAYYARVTSSATLSRGGSYSLALLADPQAAPAPGPAGLIVLGAGAAGLAYRRRRKQAVA